MLNLRLTLGCLMFCLLAGGRLLAQPVYYNTSGTTLALNTLDSVAHQWQSPIHPVHRHRD